MLCFNDRHCPNSTQCAFGSCLFPQEDDHDRPDAIHATSLTLPMIGAILHDLPSLRWIYIYVFIFLAFIGLINNIFSLMTFIRDRIRYTICGVYLIVYSICSILLMILILTNVVTAMYYNERLFRLWACHGYSYLSLVMVYTSILISTAIAVESVLIKCFYFDQSRPRKRPLLISILIFLIVSFTNLDKIFTRQLITSPSGEYFCVYERSSYQSWSTTLFFIYITLLCFVHAVCIVCVLSIRMRERCIQSTFRHQHHIAPSLFIILCMFFSGLYRYSSSLSLTHASMYTIRYHIAFVFLLYTPQILTYVIYVIPNDFYVKEFYQIWFYRKLCCCFYNRRRHIQDFEVIHRLWQRRTSLETIHTISSLSDPCVASEFYKKN